MNWLAEPQRGICVSKQLIDQFQNYFTHNNVSPCDIGNCCPTDYHQGLCFLYQNSLKRKFNLNQCNLTNELINSNLNDYFKLKLTLNKNNINEIDQIHNKICLPVRKLIENGYKYCHLAEMGPENCSTNEYCLYPYLNHPLLRLIIIDIQFYQKAIIYVGIPSHLNQSINLTDKRSFLNILSPQFYHNFETFFRYQKKYFMHFVF